MPNIRNPFMIGTYISPEYFCGREAETVLLRKHIDNGSQCSDDSATSSWQDKVIITFHFTFSTLHFPLYTHNSAEF